MLLVHRVPFVWFVYFVVNNLRTTKYTNHTKENVHAKARRRKEFRFRPNSRANPPYFESGVHLLPLRLGVLA